jgi:hypothetical protein
VVLARAEDATQVREIGAAVHAAQLVRTLEQQRFDAEIATAIDADEIGEVVLALRVVRRERIERLEERRRRKRVDAAVDLADRALLARRVALFDNAHDLSGSIADDASVAVRIVELDGEHGRRGASRVVRLEQPLQRGRLKQRNVRVEEQHRARLAREHRARLNQRVARAKLRRLNDELKMWTAGERGPDCLRAVPDDDRRRRR